MSHVKQAELEELFDEETIQFPIENAEGHSWDRQPGEPELWYERFLIYLNMPKRSLLGCWNLATKKKGKKARATSPQMTQMAREYQWKQRAREFDEFKASQDKADILRTYRSFPVQTADLADWMIDRAKKIAALPLERKIEEQRKVVEKHKCPNCKEEINIETYKEVHITEPIGVKEADIRGLIKDANKIKQDAFDNVAKPIFGNDLDQEKTYKRTEPNIIIPTVIIQRTKMLPKFVNEKKQKVKFEKYPYAERWYNQTSKNFGLMTGTQVGKSLFVRFDALTMSALGLDVLYFAPTASDVRTVVNTGFNIAIELGFSDKIGKLDNVNVKQFGNGNMYFRYSTSMTQFIAVPGDAFILDEADLCNPQYLHYLEDRISGSPYQFRRFISTPTLPDGYINKKWLKSTQEEYHIKCTHCGTWQSLDWFENVIRTEFDNRGFPVNWEPRDKEWSGRGEPKVFCKKCDKPIDRHSRGVYVANNPYAELEMCRVPSLYSPYVKMSDLMDTWGESINDPSKLTQFYNNRLAMPYTAPGAKLTPEMLDDARQTGEKTQEDGDVPPMHTLKASFNMNGWIAQEKKNPIEKRVPDFENYIVTCGVDVGSTLDYRISLTNTISGVRTMLDVGKLNSFSQLKTRLQSFDVDICVIDKNPEERKVREFQEEIFDDKMTKARIVIWSHKESTDIPLEFDNQKGIVRASIHLAYDASFSDVASRRNVLPANARTLINGQYYKEMCASIREEQHNNRKVKIRWVETEADHQRSADAFDIIALWAWRKMPKVFFM